MSISPWYTGQTLPALAITLLDDDNAPVNLTGATLALLIESESTTGSTNEPVGAGTWTITNATAGQATYAWAAADVATAGQYQLRVVVTLPNGTVKTDAVPWSVVQG